MKLLFGILSSGFAKTFGLGESDNLPGLCPELPNQENFQIERYLGQWHGWVEYWEYELGHVDPYDTALSTDSINDMARLKHFRLAEWNFHYGSDTIFLRTFFY